ncbi:unnamed protein product [Closterium sp. Naga37s-1]|nr:unnamed protein product [Closterium sp. Naga37s-1]
MLLVRSPSLLSLPPSCVSCHAIRTHPFVSNPLSLAPSSSSFSCLVSHSPSPLSPVSFLTLLLLFLLSRFPLSFSSFSCLVSHSPSFAASGAGVEATTPSAVRDARTGRALVRRMVQMSQMINVLW